MNLSKKVLYTARGRTAIAETGGDGTALVMLHGLGASKEVFARQFDSPLSSIHRMIGIDLPGHGASERSDTPEKDYTIPAVADHVAEILGMLGVQRAVVLGWSLGGHIAIQMMHAYPDLLVGVMLCGVPPIESGTIATLRCFHARWEMLLASKPNLTRRDAEKFAALCYGAETTPELAASILASDGRMRSMISRNLVRGNDGPTQRQIVETSPIPVAVLNGADDPVVRVKYIESVTYANLWENRCHEIANTGHSAFLNTPNTFNALLHRFATDVWLKEGTVREEMDFALSA